MADRDYIYFIAAKRSDEIRAVKIGIAHDPRSRLADLQTANHLSLELIATLGGFCPGKVVCGKRRLITFFETWLHGRLAQHRLRGEWFAPSCLDEIESALRDFIDVSGDWKLESIIPEFRRDRIVDVRRVGDQIHLLWMLRGQDETLRFIPVGGAA